MRSRGGAAWRVDHVAALLLLGRALNAAGDAGAAEAALKRAEAMSRAGEQPILAAQVAEAQAGMALVRGDGIGAVQLYAQAIETLSSRLEYNDIRLAAPSTGLANAQQLAGDFERSEEAFTRAIAIAAGDASGSNRLSAMRIERARMLVKTERYDEALREATLAYRETDEGTAAAKAPKGLCASEIGFAHVGLGDAAARRARFEEAIRLLRAARGDLSPDLAPGLIELAKLDLADGAWALALQHARSAEVILAVQRPGSRSRQKRLAASPRRFRAGNGTGRRLRRRRRRSPCSTSGAMRRCFPRRRRPRRCASRRCGAQSTNGCWRPTMRRTERPGCAGPAPLRGRRPCT